MMTFFFPTLADPLHLCDDTSNRVDLAQQITVGEPMARSTRALGPREGMSIKSASAATSWSLRALTAALCVALAACGGGADSTDGSAPELSSRGSADSSLGSTLDLPGDGGEEITDGSTSEVLASGTADRADGASSPVLKSSGALAQYTPSQANWTTFATKPRAAGQTAHDPDSVSWIKPADWEAARWDGTVYNPSRMSKKEFAQAICPSADRVRGIREVFYAHKPFADNANPTKAEVDEWHRIAINHVRALVGYTGPDRQVQKDHCMFARAQWGDERKFTTVWDSKYPGTNGSTAGPCQGSSNAHCGATFLPSAQDQAPYLPKDHAACQAGAGSEGVFSAPKSNIPWSIKWSRAFCSALITEGYWGGHVGPWFHRQKFGLSFWDNNPTNKNSNAVLRAKWTGNLLPNLYCNPADPRCKP